MKPVYLWFIFIGLCIGLMTTSSYTQDNDKSSSTFQKGQWALQFQITKDFTLSSFQGNTISAKYHSSKSKSIRFGLSLSGGYGYAELENSNSSSNQSTIETNNQSLTLNLQQVIYPVSHKTVILFYGYGPLINFTHQFNKSKTADSRVTSSRGYGWGLGITGVVGIEYLISADIGLIAEYSSSLKYTKNYSRSHSENDARKSRLNSVVFDANVVKFGISAYF